MNELNELFVITVSVYCVTFLIKSYESSFWQLSFLLNIVGQTIEIRLIDFFSNWRPDASDRSCPVYATIKENSGSVGQVWALSMQAVS